MARKKPLRLDLGGLEPVSIACRYRLSLVQENTPPYGEEAEIPLTRPSQVVEFLWRRIFHDEPREVMAAVFLDARNRGIGHIVPFAGTLQRTSVEPRPLLVAALHLNASGLILAHNHPSGDPSPSAEDLAFTKRLQEACEIVGLRLVDHLILGGAARWASVLRKAVW
jgi:DNA repair protein RadC